MAEHQEDWRVELRGDLYESQELEWLCSQFNSPLYGVVKEDDGYYLKAFRFAKLTSARAVREEAVKFIKIIKGIERLKGIDLQSIEIGPKVKHGHETEGFPEESEGEQIKVWKKNGIFYMKIEDRIHKIGRKLPPFFEQFGLVIKNGRDISAEDTSLHEERLYNSYLSCFNIWIDDPQISETFSYFNEKPTWPFLWNIYEMIKFDMDGNLSDDASPEKCKLTGFGWVGEGELTNFKKAANHPLAEGWGRHSSAHHRNKIRKKESKKKKPRSWWNLKAQQRAQLSLMGVADASKLIKQLFKKWFELKELEFKLAYANGVAESLSKRYGIATP
jgi:hypothetical protein